ncbi:hypothetical protein HPP92_006917 [Vanilla planifolia]|uniref:CDT1 Geminin-binding domain-containing protein n=1 Tax=Vanilla planifolia TaxID=51239 RepID=A0A835RFA2_VANPL|nr:hypothetical protein HPP92_007157 [Vanilla planifolia]KAG0490054.1 hypothetical protein HPP92_006917 [Vanilla planifolia]
MESLNPTAFSGNSSKKRLKPLDSSVLPSEETQANASSDEIPTPEKPAQLPRRAGRRSLAFSVSGVRKIALGLQKECHQSIDPNAFVRSEVEENRPSWPCSDSTNRSLGDKETFKLPEKFEMLVDFFNSLGSSIRLLQLKRKMTTFPNISASIQHLTERRFTHRHLAQMKYILPEAISIKRVLLHDEASCCMKPELQVSLHVDVLERKFDREGESAYIALRKVFRSRLFDLFRDHPEEDDIPEEALPFPFGQAGRSLSTEPNEPTLSMLIKSSSNARPIQQMPTVSHVPPSFQRRFSLKTPLPNSLKTPLASLNEVTFKNCSSSSTSVSPVKCFSDPIIHKKALVCSPDPKSSSSIQPKCDDEAVNVIDAQISPSMEIKALESTPAKDSTPARLITITPKLQTPKRSRHTTLNDTPQKEVTKRATRTKLFPTPQKTEKFDNSRTTSVGSANGDDVLGFLPESLLQDIRDKERQAIEETNAGAAGARLRKKMIACLPKLFDSIILIFQTGNRSVITKQELVHKILSSHISLVDRIEVEEQLDLLEELAPDWISGKTASTGDFLYRVNKLSSPLEIRQRLSVAM